MFIAYGCHDRNWPPITESAKKNVPFIISCIGNVTNISKSLENFEIMSNLIKNCCVEVVKRYNCDKLKNRKLCQPINS